MYHTTKQWADVFCSNTFPFICQGKPNFYISRFVQICRLTWVNVVYRLLTSSTQCEIGSFELALETIYASVDCDIQVVRYQHKCAVCTESNKQNAVNITSHSVYKNQTNGKPSVVLFNTENKAKLLREYLQCIHAMFLQTKLKPNVDMLSY